MTLNDVMAVILRYFTEFGKHVFQHMTASARIELRPTDHKSAITHRAVKFVCVTKCKDYSDTYFNLSFKFRFTVALFVLMLGLKASCCDEERRPVAVFMRESIVFCSIRVRCRRLKSLRSLSHLLMSLLYNFVNITALICGRIYA